MLSRYSFRIFIASVAGLTCLMSASIGDAVHAGATDLANALLNECMDIAERNGHAVRPEAVSRSRATLTVSGSPIAASMFKDIEGGAPTEPTTSSETCCSAPKPARRRVCCCCIWSTRT